MNIVYLSLTCPTSRLTVWCEHSRTFKRLEMFGNHSTYDLADYTKFIEVFVEGKITLDHVYEHIEQLNGWKRTDYTIRYWNPRMDKKQKGKSHVTKKN